MTIFREVWEEKRDKIRLLIGELFEFIVVVLVLTVARVIFDYVPVLSEQLKDSYKAFHEYLICCWLALIALKAFIRYFLK